MTPPVRKGRKTARDLELSSSVPADEATNVAINSTVELTFNHSINSTTVSTSTIKIEIEE